MTTKPQSSASEVTPQDYARLFDGSNVGKAVLEDLVRRFSLAPKFGPGIEGIRIDDARAGMRQVIEFILRRINQAAGAEPQDEE